MNDYHIHKNYAKAQFLLAHDLGVLDAVADDMRLVGNVFAENRELSLIVANPVVKQGKKVAIVRDIFEQHISAPSLAFILFVVRRHRAVNMRGIAEAFLDLYRESKGVVLTDFVTAIQCDDETLARVRSVVTQRTGKNDVELRTQLDPSIIGGFAICFDNRMLDARLSSRLAFLRRSFASNDYESKL